MCRLFRTAGRYALSGPGRTLGGCTPAALAQCRVATNGDRQHHAMVWSCVFPAVSHMALGEVVTGLGSPDRGVIGRRPSRPAMVGRAGACHAKGISGINRGVAGRGRCVLGTGTSPFAASGRSAWCVRSGCVCSWGVCSWGVCSWGVCSGHGCSPHGWSSPCDHAACDVWACGRSCWAWPHRQ
jgi:hypothetical protein